MTDRFLAARRGAALAVLLVTAYSATEAAAQTQLQWKLRAGQSYAVESQQRTQSQVAFSGKSADTTIDLNMALGWKVTTADDNQIQLVQKIDRLSAKLATPQGATLQFDSAAGARATGQARQLADSLLPLVGAEVELLLSPRGELRTARPLNDAAKRMLASSGASAPPQNATSDAGLSSSSLQQALRQSFIVFPEHAVAVGDEWKSTTELVTVAGPMVQTTTYKLADIADRDGDQLARIALTSQLAPAAGGPATKAPPSDRVRLKSHDQRGTIMFSITRGCLVEAEQTQKLVTERPYRDVTIVVTLTSTQKTTVTAAD